MKRQSQTDRMHRLLKAAGEGWVSALELSQISLQYCARLSEIKARGIAIENKIEIRDGIKYGFYRLRPSRPVSNPPERRANLIEEPTETLFGDIAADRSYRE
jgi:hypothetical protein